MVCRDADAAAIGIGHGRRQRQPAAGRRPLNKRDVVVSLNQVPQAGQLAHIQLGGAPEWFEAPQIHIAVDEVW
jgi:hypothetical protein